ncbi:unnamed protein product, partial [Darwinula stevensoni]
GKVGSRPTRETEAAARREPKMNLKTGLALLPFALWIQTVVAVTFKDLYRRDGEEMGFVERWMPAVHLADSIVENFLRESPCGSSESGEGVCRKKRDATQANPIFGPNSRVRGTTPSSFYMYIEYSFTMFGFDIPLPYPPGEKAGIASPGDKEVAN